MIINKKVHTVAEAAILLNLSHAKIYDLIRNGHLGAYKDLGSRAWKIPEESINSYKEARLYNHTGEERIGMQHK